MDRKLLRFFVASEDSLQTAEVAFCHFVIGVDVSQPAPIAAYLYHLLGHQEQPVGWFRRGWQVVRCLYCSYNALHQQDLRVELSCEGSAPRRVSVRVLDASGSEQEGSSISASAWEAASLSALMRSELPPEVPCLHVVVGPPGGGLSGGPSLPGAPSGGPAGCEGPRQLVELFERFAGEGDLLGLLPSTGRGTNALCEVLARQLLQSPSLLPCVETLASLQGACPLMALHISRAYARRGQLEQALSSLLRCMQAYPEEACLLRQLAELLLRGGVLPLAERAAALAVELCPTVPRYWLTLSRTQIACGRFSSALSTLNLIPEVAVSAPFYKGGLPEEVEALPRTNPRKRAFGFFSCLWLPPARPLLLPLLLREEGPQRDSREGPTGAPNPLLLQTMRRGSLKPRGSSSFFLHASLLSPAAGNSSETAAAAAAADGSSKPAAAAAAARGRCWQHRGFGPSFGLTRELREWAVVVAHRQLLLQEKKTRTRGPPADANRSSSSSSNSSSSGSSTADDVAALKALRAQQLDLGGKRRFAVLVALSRRMGLEALNSLAAGSPRFPDCLIKETGEGQERTDDDTGRGAPWGGPTSAEASLSATQETNAAEAFSFEGGPSSCFCPPPYSPSPSSSPSSFPPSSPLASSFPFPSSTPPPAPSSSLSASPPFSYPPSSLPLPSPSSSPALPPSSSSPVKRHSKAEEEHGVASQTGGSAESSGLSVFSVSKPKGVSCCSSSLEETSPQHAAAAAAAAEGEEGGLNGAALATQQTDEVVQLEGETSSGSGGPSPLQPFAGAPPASRGRGLISAGGEGGPPGLWVQGPLGLQGPPVGGPPAAPQQAVSDLLHSAAERRNEMDGQKEEEENQMPLRLSASLAALLAVRLLQL
ncbi:hypothetical protein Efla_007356 [Eimeria flavescens]